MRVCPSLFNYHHYLLPNTYETAIEAIVTGTVVASIGVITGGIRITHVCSYSTLINI